MEERRSKESPAVSLARQALETYVNKGEIIQPPQPVPDFFRKRAGVFVSIKNMVN
jgi:AMMECR1 domain-containing protein